MLIHLMLAMLLVAPPVAAPQRTDTLVTVPPGTRLDVSSRRGDVVIRTWDRHAVRVSTDDHRKELRIEQTDNVLQVRPRSWDSPSLDIQLTIPRDMPVRLTGMDTDMDVRGVGAEVHVQTLNGDINVQGGSGYVRLRTVHGDITLSDARARVNVGTVNDDITIRDVDGEIRAGTVDGDIRMTGIRSSSVTAEAVRGDLTYTGTIRKSGHYTLTTHTGDVVMDVPPSANATIRVSTYAGHFQADYPVRMIGSTEDRELTFTLGDGSADIDLNSFNGSVRLRNPGS